MLETSRKSALPLQSRALSFHKLVIVGGGMAGFGLCKRLVEQHAEHQFAIKLFGEEPRPAYDRVNVSKIFEGRTEDDLQLAPRKWYAEHKIDLVTGRKIIRIDRANKLVIDQDGNKEPYDTLVLATGSKPWVPPIPGADQKSVFVYRTIDDLKSIQRFVEENHASKAAVIGGGLLGLEASKVMLDLGLSVSILEVAPGLMPRQLDARAAKVLRNQVEELGVEVHVTRRTSGIKKKPDASGKEVLELSFENADPMSVDVLLVAAGIRARDELARDAGLECGPRGGIAVSNQLQTSDESIFAIGECAAFDGYTYGLVAPCYRMADVLADRLVGEDTAFAGGIDSVQLKLLGVPVVAFGRAIGETTSGVVLTHEGDNNYRKIILEQGCIVGAASVGVWDEMDSIRIAVARQKRLWPHQRSRFAGTGKAFLGGESLSVHQWPQDAVVCSCLGVSRGQLAAAIEDGHQTANSLAAATGASTACGSCSSLLCQLVGDTPSKKHSPGGITILTASILAVILGIVIAFAGPIPFATSVQDGWREIDLIWRDSFIKQVSGFSLLAVILLATTFSLRKRWTKMEIGKYGTWRTLHAVLGTLLLVGLVVHTGMRMGSNINFVLSCTFVALSIVGGLAGMTASLETRCSGETAMLIRAWRPRFTLLHIVLFAPLPALLFVHIASVYWY